MNVVRASKSAAESEIAAKRSPIGNPMTFLTQTARLDRSSARHARRSRVPRPSAGGGAGDSGCSSPSGTSGTGTAAPIESATCSSGGWRCIPIAWCWACG